MKELAPNNEDGILTNGKMALQSIARVLRVRGIYHFFPDRNQRTMRACFRGA